MPSEESAAEEPQDSEEATVELYHSEFDGIFLVAVHKDRDCDEIEENTEMHEDVPINNPTGDNLCDNCMGVKEDDG